MPSLTVLTEDKAVIRRALPPTTTKIFMATVARLYVAHPDPNHWTYSNIMGALVFVRDEIKNSFFLRIVDLRAGRGVIWEQELYHGFNYQADRPFFHTFATDTYTAGLSFADENEAGTLYHKVVGRDELLKAKVQPPTTSGPVAATPSRSSGWFGSKSSSKKKERPKVDKARIGLPSNFQHLGHIGWDAEKGFNVEKIPTDWKNLFDTAGITEDQLKDEETAKFVYDFVQSRGGPKSAEKPRNAPPARAPPPSSAPPPPPSGVARRPPPPPPRQRNAGPGPVPNRNGAAPPSLPDRAVSEPNPAAQMANPPSAPPMPSRSPSPVRPSVPPPAPPPLVNGNAPPAPPPPPPPPVLAPFAPPIPAPTVQPSASRIAPADGVRVDLLASIRSAGVTSLKPATAREPTSPPPEEASAGGDLASALASALAARSKAITTDSDDEEEGDDWD